MLPDIPGTEICKAIKQDKQYSAIPVILMSGIRITETGRNQGFTAGAIDFLSRPFSNTELMASIRRAFSLSRELEDQSASDREMATFKDLSQQKAPATAALFDAAPLKIQFPESYQNILKEYNKLIEDALNERFYKVDHQLNDRIVHLSDTLGFLKADAKDIIGIHRHTIASQIGKTNPKAAKIILEESRYILINLMGNLLNFYCQKSY